LTKLCTRLFLILNKAVIKKNYCKLTDVDRRGITAWGL